MYGRTFSRNVWILSYKFMKSWHFWLNTWRNFQHVWADFYPNFLAKFHMVPKWFFKNVKHEVFRVCYNLSKMFNNSLRSFLSWENRSQEVGHSFLIYKANLWRTLDSIFKHAVQIPLFRLLTYISLNNWMLAELFDL